MQVLLGPKRPLLLGEQIEIHCHLGVLEPKIIRVLSLKLIRVLRSQFFVTLGVPGFCQGDRLKYLF